MTDLKLEIPDIETPAPQRSSTPLKALVIVGMLLVVNTSLLVALLVRQRKATTGVDDERLKKTAILLEERDLPTEAAEAWERYLATADLSGEARAKVLYRIGTLYRKAGRFEKAAAAFLESKATYPLKDLEGDLKRNLKDCLEKAGKFAAVSRELMEETQGKKASPGKVLAEMDGLKITESDLDERIQQEVDDRLYSMGFTPGEATKEVRKRILERLSTPTGKRNMLQRMLYEELLYREAITAGLHKQRRIQRMLDEMKRRVLAQRYLEDYLQQQVKITPSEVKDYYKSHLAEFTEPEKVRISWIAADTEEEARKIIKSMKAGKAVPAGARRNDPSVKLPGIITKGKIPNSIPRQDAETLFSLKRGTLLDHPVKIGRRWVVIKVEEHIPPRTRKFEEVKEQVLRRVEERKRF